MIYRKVLIPTIVIALVMRVSTAVAAERAITDLIPADNLVLYTAKPYTFLEPSTQPGTDAPNPGSSLATILSMLNAGGFIPDEGQVFADIASALPLLGRFEHAASLLDISSKALERPDPVEETFAPPSLRLKHLEAAVIFRTHGQEDVVIEQLNRIVGRYTNTAVAKLSNQKIGQIKFHRLSDERLPGWAIWEWGRIEDFFVVAFGQGAFEQIARTYEKHNPALSQDSWFLSASKKTKGDRAFAQWFISLSRLKRRLGEVAAERNDRVIAALEADDMTDDLWTVGLEGRVLTCYRCYRRNGEDVFRRYSDSENIPRDHLEIVPSQAQHFAVIDAPTRWLFDNLPRAWLAAQSESRLETWEKAWRSLEQTTGIDIDGNLLKHIGNDIVVFDYPPHPLHIPLAMTIAIEIDDHKAVKMSLDALLSAWSQYLDERAERKGTTLVRMKVRSDADGIWYVQAGILGPALKVIPGYIVVSWSPQAVRDALEVIKNKRPRIRTSLTTGTNSSEKP